jgi:hypothetical protein
MYMIMNSKKPHLWKGQYCSFVDIAKLESIGYDVLKKAFYKSRDIKQAVDYAKNTFSFKDHIKYEYNGKMYNLSQVASVISKDTGHTIETIKGRIKAGWTIEDIIATPKYKLCSKKQDSYREKQGAQVKIYDLTDTLLYECNTYGEAAKFLNAKQSSIIQTCMRSGIFQSKYKIRSKSSSLEKKESDKKKRKSKNDKWCRVVYPTPELSKLAFKRCREITKTVYYEKNKEEICKKVKDYYNRNFDIKAVSNKKYYTSNKDYIREKHKEWIARNKDRHDEYHINYRRNGSDTLSDVYIKTTLATTLGLNASQITPEMIDIKRKQVKLYRSLK